jgi:UTP--glucose-1-phosphate uridylyltransferase
LCARHLVGDEPFAVILADDLIDAKMPVMKQMVDLYAKKKSSILGVMNVAREDTSQYGIVDAKRVDKNVSKLGGIVEKPKPEDAPSTLSVVGRYILTPRVFDQLEKIQAGAGKEIQLTDGIASLLKHESVFAYEFDGTGMKHAEVGKAFSEHLAEQNFSVAKSKPALKLISKSAAKIAKKSRK